MNAYIEHTLEPVYDSQSKILILGTMPSPKSREYGFYYSHPQNRFWRVMAALFHERLPESNAEKTEFLLKNRIALWDVLKSCSIDGADDGSIRDPVPNDFSVLLRRADIRRIYTTGAKATSLYRRLCLPVTKRPSVYLPSTSPANCRHYTLQTLTDRYRVILNDLDR